MRPAEAIPYLRTVCFRVNDRPACPLDAFFFAEIESQLMIAWEHKKRIGKVTPESGSAVTLHGQALHKIWCD
jgi:hypothetical protein